jgi:NitT/TauT family transport system ATP-binding protein
MHIPKINQLMTNSPEMGMADAREKTSVPAIEFQDITCSFPDRNKKAGLYTALRNATLSVQPGEFVSVVGPTGCGKSTLLNVASGLMQASSGEIRIFGEPLRGINAQAGYMFQGDTLMPWRSALSNVMAGLEFAGKDAALSESLATDWLARVGLKGFEHTYPHHLSGGMRKRVALAQMLILDPKIILMDEPFSALDIQTRQLMENELLDLWSLDRKSVLFITHDLDEAIAMSDRVIVLSAGPGTHPIGEFKIDLPRPRNVAEIRNLPEFSRLHAEIWAAMKEEVLKGYAQRH